MKMLLFDQNFVLSTQHSLKFWPPAATVAAISYEANVLRTSNFNFEFLKYVTIFDDIIIKNAVIIFFFAVFAENSDFLGLKFKKKTLIFVHK